MSVDAHQNMTVPRCKTDIAVAVSAGLAELEK